MKLETERYHVQDEVGQGAMALVYRAYDNQMKRNIALKILREDKCQNETLRIRFLREARTAGKLTHDNIVTIYDIGEIDNRPFIAMELLEGQFLDGYIRDKHKFEWQDVVQIASQLTSALNCAHQNGIVHRDIKPANIVWLEDQNKVKITDFGIARIEDLNETQSTGVGEILGTPQYMSPEQILGQVVDQRSDLFSVGVVLYQLLTGNRPFGGETIAALVYQIAHQDPQPILDIAPQTPSKLIAIVDKLLQKELSKRYQRTSELLTDLHEVEADFPHKRKPVIPVIPIIISTGLVLTVVSVLVLLKFYGLAPFKSLEPLKTVSTLEPDGVVGVNKNIKQITMQTKLTDLLNGIQCSRLHANFTTEKSVTISGFAQEEDMIRLMEYMDNMAELQNVIFEVDSLEWPFCQVVSMLQPYKELNTSKNLGLSINRSEDDILLENENLVIELTSPSYESFVYVDLFRINGDVVHLHPEGLDSLAQLPASTHLVVGQQGYQWRATEPFGDQMIVVMASINPLINGNRAKVELAQDYLAYLYNQVVNNEQELTSDYQIVTTEPL